MSLNTKVCNTCHQILSIFDFTKNRPHTDSRKNTCKKCKAKESKIYHNKNKQKIKDYSIKYREKNKVRLKYANQKWYKKTHLKRLEVRKTYYQNNKEKIRLYNQNYRLIHPILVKRRVKKYKALHQSEIYEKSKEWQKNNSERVKELSRNHYRKNAIKINKKRRSRRKKNIALVLAVRRQYYCDNKQKINQKRRDWYQINNAEILKKRSGIDYRILSGLRSRLREVLFIQKAIKLDKTMNLVGCSILKLKKHLQQQFLQGMTWDNYGFYGWHIDHIRPCSSFDLKDPRQQRKCFHYTNLQPLWGAANSSKGALYRGKRIRK